MAGSNTTGAYAPTVLCVAPFNNPHIVPTYDALAARPELQVHRVCLRALSPGRISMGWPEIDADAPYLQPWRRRNDRRQYWRALLTSDIVIFPGFQHFRTLPFHHWYRRASRKLTMLWSEPFLGHHRRPIWYYWALACLKYPVNTPNVHLLALGGEESAEDTLAVGGSSRWRSWRFGFSVHPVEDLNKDYDALLQRPVRIVYSGSLIERKRVDLLIDALGKLKRPPGDWTLDIVGDGPSRPELTARSAALGIGERITFHGYLPLQQSHTILREGDILVLPSRFDGWGAIVNEAMEYGMTVICSDTVSAKMLVQSGVNGFVFRSGNAAELASCLRTVLDDRRSLTQMCRASRLRIEQFRPAAAAERLSRLLRGLLGISPMPGYSEGLCSQISPHRYRLRQLAQSRLGVTV